MILNPDIKDIRLTPLIGLDLETTGLEPWKDKIDVIAVSTETGDKYVIEKDRYTHNDLLRFFINLRYDNHKVIGHNLKFDLAFIYYHYNILLVNCHCTMVTAQIIENGYQKDRNFDLSSILERYLNISHEFSSEKKELQKSFTNPVIRENIHNLPSHRYKQLKYAVEDTASLIPLYHQQLKFIEKYQLSKIHKLEHKLIPVLVKMEIKGCLIDTVRWKNLIETYWEPHLESLEKKIDKEVERLITPLNIDFSIKRNKQKYTVFNLFGPPTVEKIESEDALNYASSSQLLKLFSLLKEPVPLNSEKKPSVDEDTLSIYITENPTSKLGGLITLLLQFREYSKLLTTYGYNFLAKLDDHNNIHCAYTQTRTESGRLSSVRPNLQNLPSSTDEDKDVRRCFIAPKGYKIITCDMDAAEVRIAADLSQDKLLVDSIEQGVDMHSKLGSITYSIIFKRPITVSKSKETISVDGVSYILKDLRDNHKTGLFAKMYKGGAKRMYTVFSEYINAHWPPGKRQQVAKQISNALDDELPQLSGYLDRLIQEAQHNGKLVSDKLGRIRYFKQDVYGEAANYPVQGICANAQKVAMIKIDEYLDSIGGWLIINQHDETVSVVPENIAEEAAQTIKTITSDSLSWFLTRIKGDASVNIGDFWKK